MIILINCYSNVSKKTPDNGASFRRNSLFVRSIYIYCGKYLIWKSHQGVSVPYYKINYILVIYLHILRLSLPISNATMKNFALKLKFFLISSGCTFLISGMAKQFSNSLPFGIKLWTV